MGAKIEEQLGRFPNRYAAAMRKSLQTHPGIVDVMFSFPMAAAIIAAGHRPPENRGEAIWLAKRRRSAREIAEALDVPVWTRRAPPEATGNLPPAKFAFTEPETGAYSKIARHLPHTPRTQQAWLTRLFRAAAFGSVDFALWAASKRLPLLRTRLSSSRLVGAYAFYATCEGERPARKFVRDPWDRNRSARRTYELALEWYLESLIDYAARRRSTGAAPGAPARFAELQAVPLLTPKAFDMEAKVMGHCIAEYRYAFIAGNRLYFSLQLDGGERATLELQKGPRSGKIALRQLQGPLNRSVSEEMHALVELVLDDPETRADLFPDVRDDLEIDRARWRALWSPYWRRYGDGGELPELWRTSFAAPADGIP